MTTKVKNQGYRLIRPCAKCPFRIDVDPYIRPGRAKEIADDLRQGTEFYCHETTVVVGLGEDDEEELGRGPNTQVCAGALVTMERQGFANQMMRISERIGVYDPTRLDMDSPVSDSLDEWVKRFYKDEVQTVTTGDGEVLEYEHCGIVAENCIDPAGYSVGGGAADNPEPPTCHPVDDTCNSCGNPVCSECWGEPDEFGKRCLYCSEED